MIKIRKLFYLLPLSIQLNHCWMKTQVLKPDKLELRRHFLFATKSLETNLNSTIISSRKGVIVFLETRSVEPLLKKILKVLDNVHHCSDVVCPSSRDHFQSGNQLTDLSVFTELDFWNNGILNQEFLWQECANSYGCICSLMYFTFTHLGPGPFKGYHCYQSIWRSRLQRPPESAYFEERPEPLSNCGPTRRQDLVRKQASLCRDLQRFQLFWPRDLNSLEPRRSLWRRCLWSLWVLWLHLSLNTFSCRMSHCETVLLIQNHNYQWF